MPGMNFKLTYASMFDPPESLHQAFEAALGRISGQPPRDHELYIDGRDHPAAAHREKFTPIDRSRLLGRFAEASADDVKLAVAAARRAFPAWSRMPAKERVGMLRRVSEVIAERVYEIAAALSLEVGKNRLEALAEAQETADFFEFYGEDYLKRDFVHDLPEDPLKGFRSRNRSVMKPYGPWAIISPFNFPFALAGGPVAAALATGNTVVLKGATDTPWAGRLLADCIHAAGLPAGVFNYVNGTGSGAGETLVKHPDIAGITFTGSHHVGMGIARHMVAGAVPRPCIAEMGGKNAAIITARADLKRATAGIVRSAFGMGGQKCSALSRIFVDERVADELTAAVVEATKALTVGDPTLRPNWLGPVINGTAQDSYRRYSEMLQTGGARIHIGGRAPTEGGLGSGFYCLPTLAEAPPGHPLWRQEMFLPITMMARVSDRETAMRMVNDSELGLTAGFFGAEDEIDWFFDNVEAGVAYANRPQGATTGAWPGYQPFGGWKGSGTTGKGIASAYYLALYQREQSQTRVE